MTLKNTSKYISLILRHKPETIGITLDEHGWANVAELIEGVNRTHPLTMDVLEEIVSTDEKQRYSFNEDKTLIRANQGHSVAVDVELEAVKPPKYLYHGTGEKYVSSIDAQGLIPKSRLYVHLSGDIKSALKVGSRHGKPVVYRILAERMSDDGLTFYKSVNGVWLTKSVPREYIRKEGETLAMVDEIASVLIQAFQSEEDSDDIEIAIVSKYKWDEVQAALIEILLDDQYSNREYEKVAEIIWDAVLDGKEILREAIIGLLYYRLGDKNAPYNNNLIWSIAAQAYDLDYANTDFNPYEDSQIAESLSEYGISF